MAASIKISELNSLTNLTDVDLFLVSDMESGTSKKISFSTLKSNVITDTASALSDLEGTVTQNRTDAETLIENVRTTLLGFIDANETGYVSADSAITSRLSVLESDPTTQANLDNLQTTLQSQLTTLTSTVTQNETDLAALQTAVDNLDIDIAPETLNSINELADALGDDPQIVTNLQAELTAYKAHIEARNLEAGLATGVLYADTFYGG